MFNRIYIEESIRNHLRTLQWINRFKGAQLIYIEHYKDVFNRPGQDWRYQKEHQALVLAKREDTFFYKGSEYTPGFGAAHFYYNTLMLNCLYDCDYCYLQGMFPSAHVVVFVNLEDFIVAIREEISRLNNPIYLALSYDTDLFAFEGLFGYTKPWLEFSENEKQLTIEVRTKSSNTLAFKNCRPHERGILAWSVSPKSVIQQFEKKTAPLDSRISAIKTALELGWPVRLCIDPVLRIPNWQHIYTDFINYLGKSMELSKVKDISIGTFRMNHAFLKRMKQQRKDSPLLYDQYVSENDSVGYSADLIGEMYQLLETLLLQFVSKANIIFQET